jgi:hypothetical protein
MEKSNELSWEPREPRNPDENMAPWVLSCKAKAWIMSFDIT